MPPVDIATVGIEREDLAIWRKGPLLDFAVARRKELRSSAVSGKCIEVLPTVFFRGHHEPIACRPIDDAASCIVSHVGKRSLRGLTAMPNLMHAARGGISDPDGPRMRLIWRDKKSLW